MKSFFLALFLLGISPIVLVHSVTAQDQENVASRKVISRAIPIYPQMARNMNLTGAVKLEVLVAPSGSVKLIQVSGGNPLFAQAAESAVRAWKWEKSDHETTELVEVRFNP